MCMYVCLRGFLFGHPPQEPPRHAEEAPLMIATLRRPINNLQRGVLCTVVRTLRCCTVLAARGESKESFIFQNLKNGLSVLSSFRVVIKAVREERSIKKPMTTPIVTASQLHTLLAHFRFNKK